MFHIVYKTKNLINGKIYIGKHSTEDLDDGYLGSGSVLSKAIEAHGKENFSREILFTFSSEEEALAKEANIVTEDFIKSRDNYNMVVGGALGLPRTVLGKKGKDCHNFGLKRSEETKEKLRVAFSGDKSFFFGKKGNLHPQYGIPQSSKTIEKRRQSIMARSILYHPEMKELVLEMRKSGWQMTEIAKSISVFDEKVTLSLVQSFFGTLKKAGEIDQNFIDSAKAASKTRNGKRAKNENISKSRSISQFNRSPLYQADVRSQIIRLRGSGLSYQKIADILNKEGLRTGTGRVIRESSVRDAYLRFDKFEQMKI